MEHAAPAQTANRKARTFESPYHSEAEAMTKRSKRSKRRKRHREASHRAQGGRCFYCQRPFQKEGKRQMTLDHFMPKSKGGKMSSGNIVAACRSCNFDKGARDGLTYMALKRLKHMPASATIIGAAFAALVAERMRRVIRDERSDARAMAAAGKLLQLAHVPNVPEPIHPDQDCTGDMPPLSSVARMIRAAQARKYGGDRELRFTRDTRWKAPRLVDPRPQRPQQDWHRP